MRLEKLRSLMTEHGIEALIVSGDANRLWLSGYTGGDGLCLVTGERALLLTDFRYTEQAAAESPAFEIVQTVPAGGELPGEVLREVAGGRVWYESPHVTVKRLADWREKAGSEIEFLPASGLVEELRMVKDDAEIQALRKAAGLVDEGFSFVQSLLRPGVTEREIALELEFFLRRKGATKPGFEFIVASGPRSSLPHGAASERALAVGDFVTLDFGCYVDGYTSDTTRTVVLGKASDEQRRIYEIVQRAQEEGFRAVKPGRSGIEVDSVARTIIAEAGHASHFGHGLGHGVGLEVHERPRLSVTDSTKLEPGMVVTVEPGIYIPGFGGVRIEDMVLVTATGGERLTSAPRELIEI